MFARFYRPALALALVLGSTVAHADVRIEAPWVRATVPGQQATGAFMQLTAATDSRLVAAHTPIAGATEIHEMTMDNDVMRMRQVDGIALPAGKTVELRPGGYHIMMLNLPAQVAADTQVPLSLTFESNDGKRETVEVQAPVRALTAGAGHGAHGGGHSHQAAH